MIELTVNSKVPAAISNAFKKISEMVKTGAIEKNTLVHIVLGAGVYNELLNYNLSNPLIIEAASGVSRENCVVRAENCESFHRDTENRAVFVIGPSATFVTLRGFSIHNTHIKTLENEKSGDQAEALCFHNQRGRLDAENMAFKSHQDTIHVKGFSHFKSCLIEGDVDFIWGYCDTSFFEDCIINTIQDNRGDMQASVLQSRAVAKRPGFIFKDCEFLAEKRATAKIYIARANGKGSEQSADRWDSVALINCTVGENYTSEFFSDEGGTRAIFPKGSALFGFREYGTKTRKSDGSVLKADTTERNALSYVMSEEEYEANYKSNDFILRDFPKR